MFWIYSLLIVISGGSGIGFIIHEKYVEAIIAFIVCFILIVLLRIYLRRKTQKRHSGDGPLDCGECSDLDCDCND
ncbi:hypothetical protein ACEOWJ_002513 [Bacillus cereus]|uniref:hypothetical protein n=1 Tax=Bacillus TaxID=1386 RepID=UPI00054E2814|nr:MULTISPECIES: hypothetical protein [unclassified Bacillus (in: firmicutes)]